MKIIFQLLVILFLVWSCSSQKKMMNLDPQGVDLENGGAATANDSIEYNIETFDTQFEIWYQAHNSETSYHSLNYYEQWNRQYVAAWNENATDPRKGNFFELIVGYDPETKYSLELNHKLFYYFQYVENVLKVKIMSYSPKSAPF
ncbi:MAG: hypothetical protein JXR61_12145 [Prolixibacteraceae bacterium]|nr:hypothetical protein [Prolixibacteraceae bacterium]